jgi:hypothetical protein
MQLPKFLVFSAVAVAVQSCIDVTMVPFSTDPANPFNVSAVHMTIYELATGTGVRLIPNEPQQVCGEGNSQFKVSIAEEYGVFTPTYRYAYLVVNGHRVFTFAKPQMRYTSVFFGIKDGVVSFTDWIVDDYIERMLPKSVNFSRCKPIDVSFSAASEKNGSATVTDISGNLIYYGSGQEHVLKTEVFQPEICNAGNYSINAAADPYDPCLPLKLNWQVEFDAQVAYSSFFFAREIANFKVSGNVGSLSSYYSKKYGSGVALPTPACPGFLHTISPAPVQM